ncbi:MAG: HK97-gp10 family putative phage morphogenesis protein [Eubacteriales bacterium]
MAKFNFSLPDDLLLKLSTLEEKTDEIVPEVLKAGGEIVLNAVKSKLTSVIGSGTKYPSRSTGELVDSLGMSDVRLDKNNSFNIKIGFAEPRSDGGSNAQIANVIEYGKSGQPAKPFLKPAKSSSKTAAIEAMRNKFDEKVSKL